MLKMHFVTDVFVGAWPKFTKRYFKELVPMNVKQKPVEHSLGSFL